MIKLCQVQGVAQSVGSEVIGLDYILREGVILITGKSHQVTIKGMRLEQSRQPIMQQVSADNPITCNTFFMHHGGEDSEVRACGFRNGGMAIYSCQDITVDVQNAIKYFFPVETARPSSTLESYSTQKSR